MDVTTEETPDSGILGTPASEAVETALPVEAAEAAFGETPEITAEALFGELQPESPLELPPDVEKEEAGVEKALRDTKAWATRLSQDNAELRRALDAVVTVPPPALLSDPDVGCRLERARKALEPFEEFGPLVELLDTMVRGVAGYEREVAHHALVHAVLTEHPDALDLRADTAFLDWVERQPPVVRACLAHSTDPAEVSWALGLYKRERGADSARRAREEAETALRERMRHTASPSPQTGSQPSGNRFTRDEIARMSLEDYRKNEADIDAALSRGEIR